MANSLRGKLLIAAPSLFDTFRRSVVLVIEHNEDGAFGVVLNRPSEASVVEVVPDLAELADPADPLWIGGPVGTESVVALGEFAEVGEAGTPLFGALGLLDPELPTPATLLRLRVFAGHAGWAPGQLDDELERDAWIVASPDSDDPFCTEDGDLWSEVLARKGGAYTLLSTMPEDPTRN